MEGDTSSTLHFDTILNDSHLLQILLEQTNDYIFFKDKNSRFIKVNRKILEVFGVSSEEEILGKTNKDFFPDIADQLRDEDQRIMETGEPQFNIHREMNFPDGSKHWVSISKAPFYDNNGNVSGIVGISRDITKEKEQEKRNKNLQKNYNSLFNTIRSGVAVYEAIDDGADFIFKDFNAAAEKIEGVKKEYLIGRKVTEVFPGVKNFGIFEVFQRVWQTGKAEFFPEAVYKDKQNPESWRENWVYKLSTDEIVSVYDDVTERKQKEKILRESERKLRNLIDSTSEFIWEVDHNGVYTYVSENVSNITGFSPSDILGKTPFEFMDRKEAERVGQLFSNIVAKQENITALEDVWTHKEGHDIIFETDGTPLINEKGELTGYFGICRDITDRKKSEEVLKKSEEKYHTLFEHMAQGVFYQRADGKIFDVNPSALDIFGLKKDQTLGRTSDSAEWKVIREDGTQLPPNQHPSMKALRTGKPIFDEIIGVYNPKKKDHVWVSTNSIPQFKPGKNKPYQVFVTLHDITERKKAEEELKESEKKYREIVELSPDGIATSDIKGVVTSVNSSFLKITGYSKDEIVGKHVSRLPTLNLRELPNYVRIYKDIIMGKQTKPFTFQWKHKNGQLRWGECRFTVQKNNGKKTGVQVNLRDITDRIEYEKNLKEKQEQLNLALEGGELGTWDWNIKTNDIQFSKRWVEMKGYKPEEIKPHLSSWEQLVHPDDLSIAQKLLNDHLNGKIPFYEAEYRMKHKSGEWLWILDKGKVIELNKKGKPLRACGTHLDITKRKKMEIELQKTYNELQKLNNQLEEKVQQRTEELEKVIKLKDGFINQLGHDLKNPLGPFIQLVPILKNHAIREKDHQMLDVLERNARYMKNLVKKTIELAKLNSSKIEFIFEPTSLKNIIETVLSTNQTLFEEHEMIIENKISSISFVEVDRLRIEEVFNNLFNNAIKYRKGPGTITIDAEQKENQLILSVGDTGIGITQEQINHLFDEYYKADTSRHDFDSSGLGLPICKRIIEKHGGKIWAKSEGLNKGSTFYFTLPLAKQ